MRAWRTLPFSEVVADETAGNAKTLQSDFQPEGTYPIVDQGKGLIAGYTDDPARLCKVQTPAIIFGDHTKTFKFIDFPFCLGADGTKVLRPKTDTDEKYLYWYLQTIKIPDAGYSRHFKYLNRSDILLPPVDVQRRIATILDAADALRAKRSQALSALNRLTESIFNKMLGDPQSKNWPLYSLTDIFYFTTGKLDSNAAVSDGLYPFFTCSREDFRINTYAFDCEALLLAGNNASADYSVKHYKGKFNAYQRTYVLTLKDTNNAYPYARIALEHQLADLKRFSKGTNTKYLTMSIFDDRKLCVPPVSVQNRFAVRVQAIELLRAHHSISLASMNRLFFSLQDRAFCGEL